MCPFVSSRDYFHRSPHHLNAQICTLKAELCTFHLDAGLLSNTKRTFPSSFFTNDLFFLSKSAPKDTANRWGLKSLAVAGLHVRARAMLREQQAGPGRKERALSFRAAITEPAESWHPLSTMWGVKHSLTPQGTLNKKLPSLESQRGSDGRR